MSDGWIQAITIIGSILVPTLLGFAWILHQLSDLRTRVTVLETRMGFIERMLEMMGYPFKSERAKTDP
jgi:hypothetical protein